MELLLLFVMGVATGQFDVKNCQGYRDTPHSPFWIYLLVCHDHLTHGGMILLSAFNGTLAKDLATSGDVKQARGGKALPHSVEVTQLI